MSVISHSLPGKSEEEEKHSDHLCTNETYFGKKIKPRCSACSCFRIYSFKTSPKLFVHKVTVLKRGQL